ncbi:MAG: transposase [Acidobacteria bacterium]|nr:transposase [Acidobacteriota bacterium]
MRAKPEGRQAPGSGFVLTLDKGAVSRAGGDSRRKHLMLGLGPATKICVGLETVDIRKGFDGLYGLVRDRLGQDP